MTETTDEWEQLCRKKRREYKERLCREAESGNELAIAIIERNKKEYADWVARTTVEERRAEWRRNAERSRDIRRERARAAYRLRAAAFKAMKDLGAFETIGVEVP